MRRIFRILIYGITIYCLSGFMAIAKNYILTPGDLLTMSVWGFNDLQLDNTIIRPDGKLAFPLIGEIEAAGLSLGELSTRGSNLLSAYINNPKVTMNIAKYYTVCVYVLGDVAKPVLFELEKQHNLLDALGAAGSYTKDAAA